MANERRITWQTLFGISGGILSVVALIAWTLFLDRMKNAEGNIVACEASITQKVDRDDFKDALDRIEGHFKEMREKDDRIIEMLQTHEQNSSRRSRAARD